MIHAFLVRPLVLFGILLAYQQQPGPPGAAPDRTRGRTPQQEVELRRDLVRWVECDESHGGQLQAVVRWGEAAVPSLAATLEQGPSLERMTAYRNGLGRTYEKLKAYSESHPDRESEPLLSLGEFVGLYTQNFIALYKSRAAIALGRTGGAAAKSALEKAQTQSLRPDVARSVKDSLARLNRSAK